MNPTIQELLRHVAQSEGGMNTATFSLATMAPALPGDRAGARSCSTLLVVDLFLRDDEQPRDLLAGDPLAAWAPRCSPASRVGRPTVVTFHGMFVADLMSQVLKVGDAALGGRDAGATAARTSPTRGLLHGRIPLPRALRHARHDGDDLGAPLPHALPGPRAAWRFRSTPWWRCSAIRRAPPRRR